ATTEEIKKHFDRCGFIVRATILSDKCSGNPKGFAYIEVSNDRSVELALALNNSIIQDRLIIVNVKRKNIRKTTCTD
ncbi:hypothetical protein HELRODRAFT_87515, partial [Helobdella robusta]|uniref:RRM domain-containing protein n=1 Tax=Helobdella robusta TaxID=6412 RepID=T1G6R4_HELRO